MARFLSGQPKLTNPTKTNGSCDPNHPIEFPYKFVFELEIII